MRPSGNPCDHEIHQPITFAIAVPPLPLLVLEMQILLYKV